MIKQTLSVSAIHNGSVIDHIPSGEVLKLISILKLSEERLYLGLNLPSKRMGKKDLLKVHNLSLSESDLQHIAIFAPKATINIIQDYQIIKKLKATLPSVIHGVLKCPNENCITRHTPTKTRFHVKSHKEKLYLSCDYCNKDHLKDTVREVSL